MASNTISFSYNTDFNVNPWYDDYDQTKGFYRIVFKPSVAVQARELTQLQTMLQKQIDRFAEHIFKEGSLVAGGQFHIDTDIDYVKINDTTSGGGAVVVNNLVGATMTGATTGVKAFVVSVADGSQAATDKKTLFVRYTSSGTDNVTKVFADGEILTSSAGNAVVFATSATGKGATFTIDDGIVFSKDHFITFVKQTIILDRYTQTPSARIGFNVLESIVTAQDDPTLNDPALGAYNYAAPGADRFKLEAVLAKTDLDDVSGPPNFVELFRIRDGILEVTYERTQYSAIRDELARRTDADCGDFYATGLNVRIREHKDNGTNQGLYTTTGNTSLLVAGVEPGLAYVKGYDVETLVTKYTDVRKAIDAQNINNQVSRTRMGNYLRVKELCGSWDMNSASVVWLYNTAQARLTNLGFSTAAQTGAAIGNAKVRGIELHSGVAGTPSAQYNVYLFDVKMSNGAFSSVRSLYLNNASTADLGADVVLDPISNTATLLETSLDASIYDIGAGAVKAIRDSGGNVDTSYSFTKSFPISIASGGTFTINTGAVDEIFPYGVGGLVDDDKEEIIISLDAAATKTMGGTVATHSNTTINGTSTFFTRLNVGDKISISTVTGTFFIDQIVSDTVLKTTVAIPSTVTGQTFTKQYKIGDIVDFTGKGADAGTDRTITINSSTSASFDMKETLSATTAATATLRLTKTTARETAKLLRPSRYVKIDGATSGTTGPFNLGIADVYQIRSVRTKSSAFTASTDGTDVTSNFIFDNGQRDNLYDHATITPITPIASGDYLLVCLDHFEPSFTQGLGYFSVDSYPINDATISDTSILTQQIPVYVSPTTGIRYDLRNSLDFRPVKAATATSSTTVAGATANPAKTTSFTAPSGGLHLPSPSGQVTYDYSYYMSRKDLVIMDSAGNISIVEGQPATVPITPTTPPNAMALATLTIAPYPSLSPAYAIESNRQDLACTVKKTAYRNYTKRDIGVLDERISNLEYYNQLNLLEKQASDLSILDENGLDRFKNGIFVDTFRDHSQGAITNPDYSIVVDPKEQSIRPQFDMDSVGYQYVSGSGVQQSNNLITLPYTEVSFIEQPYATTTRNSTNAVYNFIGLLTLTPDSDVWVDTVQLPDTMVGDSTPTSVPPLQTTWDSWQTTITGYKVYNNSTGALIGTYTTEAAALSAAQTTSNRTGQSTKIEQFGSQTRSGTTTTSSVVSTTENLGNKVVDVSIIPYIRPQTVLLSARDIKPNTRLWVYVDDELMSDYTTPANSSYSTTGVEGANWISGTDGKAYALLRFPDSGKRFRTGTKKIRVSDSPTNEDDSTTYALAYFTASGLIQQKQDTILSTNVVVTSQDDVSQTGGVQGNVTIINPIRNPTTSTTTTGRGGNGGSRSDCMAYTFFINAPTTEEGIFLTSFDLYFEAKNASFGAWFEVREVDNSGNITRNTVPYSVVALEPSQIQISDDATVATRIYFQCPIFLYNNVEYALVIHPTATNPDTYVWITKLGEADVTTGQNVVSRKYTGTLFDTNNNMDWTPVPNADLKITFYRADFTTNSTGTANFGNKPFEKFIMSSVTSDFDKFGEIVRGQNRITISGNTAAIAVGNRLVGATSHANSQVVAISGGTYRLSANSIMNYTSGETLTIKSNTGTTRGTATLATVTYPSGSLYSYRAVNATLTHLELRDTTGYWEDGEIIIGSASGDRGTIGSKIPIKYSVVDFEPNYLTFQNTSLGWTMKGTSNTNSLDSTSIAVIPDDNNFFTSEKNLLGRSKEVDLISSARSNQAVASIVSSTPYVSPVIDLNRTHGVFVHNVVNANTANETAASGGAAQNKYICKTITLAEGQDAEDLKVYLTAYRPPNTDVLVYAKIANNEDSDTFESHPWIQLETSDTVFSSISNQNDWIEYEFGFSDTIMTGLFGAVQYTNSNGVAFSGFKQFSIKIVLTSTDSAMVPRVADLRLIALQM
jgi:hypothetical protein